MHKDILGKITRINGSKIAIRITADDLLNKVAVNNLLINYISIGSLLGTNLVDGRTLILTVEEIIDTEKDIMVTASISGTYDAVLDGFSFGTNSFPLINEDVFKVNSDILSRIFSPDPNNESSIGTYIYDKKVQVGYNPNILFGKHLGVFGNTGSGKTCSVVSIIQHYIRNNATKDIKFLILDVNGEYQSAFGEEEAEYIPFNQLRFHHSILSNTEYGRLFRAAEGVQYPALKDCISELSSVKRMWDMNDLPDTLNKWIESHAAEKQGRKDEFSKNQISGYLRTMCLRVDGILEDDELMTVINSPEEKDTLSRALDSDKKVIILDLQVSSDSLDIVVYMLFKAVYEHKMQRNDNTHLSLVLEEAHRYINTNADESKLGSYYIDKLSREGRKFGIGLIIASQIPSMLAYDVVSQCNSVIMHKITNRRDLEFLKGVLRVSNDTYYLQMSALEKQYAIVCGEAFSNDAVVKMYNANPLPASNDPKILDNLVIQ